MIFDAIGHLMLSMLDAIATFLPDADVEGLEGFGVAITAFKAFDVGLPVSETLALGGAALGITGALFVGRVILMIWHAIPGKFT